jgi:hypothetical protein
MRTGARAALVLALGSCAAAYAQAPGPRSFATPEEAVRVLVETVKKGDLPALLALFGPDGKELVDSSDPATGRRNRQVFVVAIAEGWRLVDGGPDRKELVIGNEAWPFPVPLVRREPGWVFDAAAGREEILARRVGRNELAVMGILRGYVAAQYAYARTGHDGLPRGVFARRFASDPGTHNGLYWPAAHGEPRSPLGALVAAAAEEGRPPGQSGSSPSPFHGYFFRILEAQGPAAEGGARDYVVDGHMTGGFALVAWPVHYDASGVMTFVVNQDGVVFESDLGPGTQAAVVALSRFDPGEGWHPVEPEPGSRP